MPDAPQLWLTNRHATVGVGVLDQYRGLRRPRSFDLNAASVVDLLGVPGVERRLADAIIAAGPYQRVDDLTRVPGMTASRLGEFRAMAANADARVGNTDEDVDLRGLIVAYGLRVLAYLLLVAVCAAVIQRLIRRIGWRRALLVGVVGALLGALPAWVRPAYDGGSAGPGAALVACCMLPLAAAVPATLLHLARHRSPRAALSVLAGWLASALPVVAVTWAWW
jgi:hypothetical protein